MHVLVAVDDSEPARDALEFALAEHPAADLTALSVVDPSETVYGEFTHPGGTVLEDRRADAEATLERVHERAAPHDGAFTTAAVIGRPAHKIVTYAEEHDVDRIVVGSHGRDGLSRVALGSVAELVARRAPVPVTIVR